MWILTSKKTGSIYYLLPEKTKHVVGRTTADLVLKDDTSISRTHACLYVAQDHIKLVDVGSKYGTFYNENIENKIEIEKNKPIQLENGERIQFGLLGNEWTLSKLNICTLISSLNADQRTEMQRNLDLLGGRMTDTWMDSCTHLTMPEITVTLKALKALVENIPIVSCDYWKAYYKNLQDGKPPPKCEEYLPKLAETFLNKEIISFGLNDKRKTIFQGKTFIFMDRKLFDKYYSIITCAGGVCRNLNEGIQKSFLIKKDVAVIQHVSSSQSQSSQTINMIEEHIKRNGRRLIPDFEIGLAVINCSTEKYCNSGHDIKFGLLPQTSTNTLRNTTNILAAQTPLNTDSDNLMCKDSDSHDSISVEIPESALPESATYNPEKSQTATNEDIHQSHESENLEIEVEQMMEVGEESSKACKRDVSQDNLNKNLKRKRSSFGEDEDHHTKKAHCSKQESRFANVKKSQKGSVMLSLDNFLDKSQIRKTNQEKEVVIDESKAASQQTNSRKRGKIAVIRDDDEEDENGDDLFNFGAAAAKRAKQSTSRFNNSDHEEERNDGLFSFSNRKNDTQQPSLSKLNNVKENGTTHPLNQSVFNKPSNISVKRVEKPLYFSTEGWLSKSMSKIKIKPEDKVKEEKDETNPSWIDAIRDGFEIRVRPMQIVTRSFQNNAPVAENNNENNSCNAMNTTKKNFKAFVKKCNYKPQKEIAPTVSFRVMCDFAA